jgi:hypothetical protein
MANNSNSTITVTISNLARDERTIAVSRNTTVTQLTQMAIDEGLAYGNSADFQLFKQDNMNNSSTRVILKYGFMPLSHYNVKNGDSIYIITEETNRMSRIPVPPAPTLEILREVRGGRKRSRRHRKSYRKSRGKKSRKH